VPGVLGVERVDAVGDVLPDAIATVFILGPPVVLVPRKVYLRSASVISEQHVLRVVVDEIFLFGGEVKVTDEL